MLHYTSHCTTGLSTQEAHSSTSSVSAKVNLTFVPDTAVAKIVTKTNQEAIAAAEPVIDRRTAVMEQRKDTLKEMSSSNEFASDVQDMEVDNISQVVTKDVTKGDNKQINIIEHVKEECTTSTPRPEALNEKPQVSVIDSNPSDVSSSFSPNKESTEKTGQITVIKQESNANGGPKKNDSMNSSETISSQVPVKQENKPDNKDSWKAGEYSVANNGSVKSEQQRKAIADDDADVKGPFFRLGMEDNFSGYVNHFATDPLALNRQQHMENKERRRAVSNKFSVFHEFKLSGEIFGPKDVILNTLRCSIVNLENNIPAAFMHPVWPIQRSTWVRAVHMATTPVEFAAALCFLESLIKPVCFLPVWNDSLGHTELHRAIVETKADKKKREHKEEEEDVDYRDRVFGK